MKSRVIIVDDHPLFRAALARGLSGTTDLEIVGEASHGEEALKIAQALRPDIVLLDYSLPGKSGLETLKSLLSGLPGVRVLMLSGFSDGNYVVRCLRAGAKGYITKHATLEEIATAIRKVMRGGKFISSAVAEVLANELDSPSNLTPHKRLSDREFQILRLFGEGRTLSEIASIVSLSVSTVNTYRVRILTKLGLKTTAEMVRYALENDLVPRTR